MPSVKYAIELSAAGTHFHVLCSVPASLSTILANYDQLRYYPLWYLGA